MRVLWSDPGETVGWATADVIGEGGRPKLEILDYGNTKLKTFALKLAKQAHTYDVVGFETYTIRPDKLRAHAGSTVPTLQLIGMIRLGVWQGQEQNGMPFPEIAEQDAGHKSKGLGATRLWLPDYLGIVQEALEGDHDDGHYGDAILHLACWFHERFYEGKS